MLTSVLFLVLGFPAVTGDKHSLLYLYTIQSKTSDSHLYDCTAVTLLNDRQIDFYSSSSDKPRTAKQNWMKIISESDWKTSTEKLQGDRELVNKLLDIHMAESGHSHSDGHVLQWRHGCEGEQSSDGSLTVLNSINEFGYDGEDLIQFNCTSKTWITPEEKKNREREEEKNREREEKKNREREEKKNREREEKWNKDHQYRADKKCLQCEEMLKMYLKYKTTEQYRTTDIAGSQTPPAVHIFAKKSVKDSGDLTLTCLITGFYPKDVKMSVRKFTTSLPDHLITSSGVRPNDDGTYQLRKSVEISGDDSADYDCYVSHSSLTKPVIKQWDGRCTVCPDNVSNGLFIIVVLSGLVVVLWSVMLCLLIVKTRPRRRKTNLCKVFEQIKMLVQIWVKCPDNVYLRLIIGVSVSGVLAALGFLMLCVLVMIIKIATCPDCTDHISQGLMIGGVVSGMLVLLCPVILRVLIKKIKKYGRCTVLLYNIYWDLIIGVVRLVLILYSVTLCVLIWRIKKYGRTDHLTNIYWGLMIGAVGLVLILYSVILGVLIKIIKKNPDVYIPARSADSDLDVYTQVSSADSDPRVRTPARSADSGKYSCEETAFSDEEFPDNTWDEINHN